MSKVIRMYRTLVGEAGFRKGMDLYFKRHDGQAVSCDDFRAAMADANSIDLDQFERWYLQVSGVRKRSGEKKCPWVRSSHEKDALLGVGRLGPP